MTDRDLERRLGDWLDSEAPRAVPHGLRSLLATLPAQTEPTRRGFRPRWTVAVAFIVMVILLTAALTLSLLGLIPHPPADCSGVSIDGIRAAVATTRGYTYQVEGTDVVNPFALDPIRTPPADPYDHVERQISISGGYQAPDRWRFDIEEGSGFPPVRIPEIALLQTGHQSIVGVGGEIWARPWLTPFYVQPDPSWLLAVLGTVNPNALAALLTGEEWSITDPLDVGFVWNEVAADGDRCVLRGTASDPRLPAALSQILELSVDPDSMRPVEATTAYVYRPPDDTVRWVDRHLHWQISDSAPQIELPAERTPRTLNDGDLRDAAAQLGVANPHAPVVETRDTWQAAVVRGDAGYVEMVFADGIARDLVNSTASTPLDVRLNDPEDDVRFLFVVVDDPRVATVQVDLASEPDVVIDVSRAVEGVVIQQVGAHSGLNRWAAFDAAGNELPDLVPPF